MKIKKGITVGIDLGTTNSVAAIMRDDTKEIICYTDVRRGLKTVPSVVAYDKRSDSIIVGRTAFMKRGNIPEPIVSIKSHMSDREYKTTLNGVEYSAVNISAIILKELVRLLQEQLNGTPGCEDYLLDSAVITVPAYFLSDGKEATALAAEEAGLKLKMLLAEPSASAVYYCFKNQVDDGVYLVFDLGGGTFDVSILRREGGETFVLATAGNNKLGGDNFDEVLAYEFIRRLQEEDEYNFDGFDPDHNETDRNTLTKLKLKAEHVKKALSRDFEVEVDEYDVCFDKLDQRVNIQTRITREEFEALISDLIKDAIEVCEDAIKESATKNITLDMIDAVLMVGGSTHIPLVHEMVRNAFCDASLEQHTKSPIPLSDEPDMAVGYGAAICAASLGVSFVADTPAASAEETPGDTPADVPAKRPLTSSLGNPTSFDGESTVDGVIEGAEDYAPLTIFAQRDDGSFSGEFSVEPDGSFSLSGLPAEGERAMYTCEIRENGKAVSGFSFNAVGIEAGTPPVTLNRTFYIDVLNPVTGEIEKDVFIENGASLPANRELSYLTDVKNNELHVIIYEENTMFKKIVVPYRNGGKEVKLLLRVEATSSMVVRVLIDGEEPYEERLEPPKHVELRERDIEDAGETANNAISYMSTVEQHKAKLKLKRLKDAAYAALEKGDQQTAREKKDEMLRFKPPKQLTPERNSFDAMLAQAEELNREYKNNDASNLTSINNVRESGHEAYDENNQAGLTKAVERLKALIKTLTPTQTSKGSEQDKRTETRELARQVYGLLQQRLLIFKGELTELQDEGKLVPVKVNMTNQQAIEMAKAQNSVMGLFAAIDFSSDDKLAGIQEELRRIARHWMQAVEITVIKEGKLVPIKNQG